MNNIINKIIRYLWIIFKISIVIVLLWLFGVVFVFSSFRIPTESMLPTLIPGDCILVNKLYMGARLFDVNSSIEHKPFDIYRIFGYSSLKTGDVAVFNNPYPNTRDSIEFDVMKYFVKRCIAIPGDTLEIRKAQYIINGCKIKCMPRKIQLLCDSMNKVSACSGERINGVSINAFPKKKEIGWTILNFGPMYVPAAGSEIVMTERNYLLYHKLIEWEQKRITVWNDGRAFIGDKPISKYKFTHGYYFMVGDNIFNSVDSRYWGLVPDDFIVGKAFAIWKSVNPYTSNKQYERIGLIH